LGEQDKDTGHGHDNILHFEHAFTARLVETASISAMPMSPKDFQEATAQDGRAVKITLVADKIQVEDGEIAIGKAKPPPIVVASFWEVRQCFSPSIERSVAVA
jgi:hypothetical protein